MFAFAKEANAFSISPSKFLVTADQGMSQTITVKIKNNEAASMQFSASVLGAKQDDQGHPVFGTGIDDAENWVRPEIASFNIVPGETKTLDFFINVPKDTLSGSHYLGLAVEPIYPKGSQVSLGGRLVSILTLQVSGTVNESLGITRWKPSGNLFTENIWKFNLELKNSGDIEVPAVGSVSISNWKGKEIFSENLNLGNQILAGSLRSLEPSVVLADKGFWPGLYQAKIKVSYGKTGQVAYAMANAWYLPLWSIFALCAFFVVLIAVIIFLSRSRHRV